MILRSIRVDDLFPSLWVGGIWGWSGLLGSCDHGLLFHVWLWFLGLHLFDACFVVKRVLWFWTIREIRVIYIVVLIKVMRWLLLSGCDSWFLSWCCKLWFLGWVWWCFGVICLWSGFGAVSGLMICSGVDTLGVCSLCSCWLVFWVDWLVVGGDLCFSGVEWWLCELVFVWDRWLSVWFWLLIVGTVLVIAEFGLSCWSGCVVRMGYRGHLSWWLWSLWVWFVLVYSWVIRFWWLFFDWSLVVAGVLVLFLFFV